MTEDAELLARVLSGETSAFEPLVRKYQDKVYRLCCSFVGQSAAEDAAQEIFIKVFESLDQFKSKSSFATWLYRIAANHCLNIIAKRKRERQDSLDAITEQYGDSAHQLTDKSDHISLAENKAYLSSLLEQLPPDQKAALVLREVNGLTYQELAEALDISLDAVKVRLFRARQSLVRAAQKGS